MDYAKMVLIISEIASSSILIMCGPILYFWMKPFVKRKRALLLSSASYALLPVLLTARRVETPVSQGTGDVGLMAAFGVIGQGVPLLLLKWLPVSIAFFFLCVGDRRAYRQKCLLLFLFIFLRWLTFGMFSELGYLERDLVANCPEIFRSVEACLAEFVLWEVFWVCGTLLTLFFALRRIQKVYDFKQEELEWQEFFMLMAPITAMFLVRPLTMQYYELWSEGILNGTILKNLPWNPYRFGYYFCAYFGCISLICFYQKIKRQQQEKAQGEILMLQLEENKRSMEKIRALYDDMSALKHDMGNHIAVIEQAILQGQATQAAAYAQTLRGKWEETKPRIATGNPITDIVLSETDKKCEQSGIEFRCDFRFPKDAGLDVFDLSVVLTNALENAMEAQRRAPDPEIAVSSFERGGVFIVSVKNAIPEKISLEEGGLPISGKPEKGHGYGLLNIRKVARSYGGDMDIRQLSEDGKWWFVLDVMMRLGGSQQK